jgi:hypothetical protein
MLGIVLPGRVLDFENRFETVALFLEHTAATTRPLFN